MICEITKDKSILLQKSEKIEFTNEQKDTWSDSTLLLKDLIDTANAHSDVCAGLSAIQISVPKRMCVIKLGDRWQEIINPVIVKTTGETKIYEEGCLSVEGLHNVKRFTHIFVKYERLNRQPYIGWISGLFAEVFQHELDHMNGILI